MKKLFFAVIIIASLSACNSSPKRPSLAVGTINKESLLSTYQPFAMNFDKYSLTVKQIEQIKKWPDTVSIDVYFGTWCPDSQREVPKLLKVISMNPKINVNLIALDRQKSDPQGLAKKANIAFTATFVVLKNGQEVGRVIERPKVGLITDLNEIITNN